MSMILNESLHRSSDMMEMEVLFYAFIKDKQQLCAHTCVAYLTFTEEGNISVAIIVHRPTSNISRTLVKNKIVDHSDVVGASPVGAAPITSSFST